MPPPPGSDRPEVSVLRLEPSDGNDIIILYNKNSFVKFVPKERTRAAMLNFFRYPTWLHI